MDSFWVPILKILGEGPVKPTFAAGSTGRYVLECMDKPK